MLNLESGGVSRLPPELLRKGRFDELFFVDLPDADAREEIFKIHLSLRKQTVHHFALRSLVQASDGFGGAEIEQVIITALYQALYLKQPLTTELILAAIEQTIPLSVSRREDVIQLRQLACDRFVSAK